jgi:DNA (cytosine-5)-methyltransferase 1
MLVKPSSLLSKTLKADGYFCGAGGLEVAFKSAIAHLGIDAAIRIGVNHWNLAIDSFSANHPEANVACMDVRTFDPTQFGRSDIGLLAPACEKFSRGRGIADDYDQQVMQLSLWEAEEQSLKEKQSRWERMKEKEREKARLEADYSRLSMYQVVRLIDYNRWPIAFVENVCDALKWAHYPKWVHEIEALGYWVQPVIWNAMFARPPGIEELMLCPGLVPQSRNRVIWVISRKDLPKPDLRFDKAAYCARCEQVVMGRQTWKNPTNQIVRGINDYGPQWYYSCPHCRQPVEPPITPAYSIIDWSIPCPTVGARKDAAFRKKHNCRVIKPTTRDRLGRGLRKFGVQPLLIGTDHTQNKTGKVWGGNGVSPTQTTRQTLGIAVPPTSPFIVQMYGTDNARAIDRPMGTVTTAGGAHHFVTLPPGFNGAWLHSYYSREDVSTGIHEPVPTVTGQPRHGVVLSPFLSSYYGNSIGSSLNSSVPTITTRDRHSLVLPSGECLDLDNPDDLERAIDLCGFRMFNIGEIKRVQGLPDGFVLKGNQKQKGHLAGQAVPPPSAAEIMVRALQILL